MIPSVNAQFRSPLARWGFALLLTGILLLVACNGEDPLPPNGTPTPEPDIEETPTPEEEREEGGSLIVAIPNEPDSLNFSLTTLPSAHWILSTVDARMIRVTSDNSLQPQLLREVPTLENGGISEDGLVYTLRFLPDLTWSDGEPVDARDFAFTWETLTSSDYPAVALRGWTLIEDVTVSADNLSAVIRLRSPSADFVNRVLAGGSGQGAGFLLPRHLLEHLEPAEIASHEYGAEQHVGAGPFRIVEWEPGEQIIVERNDEYWGESPLLDRIVFRFPETSRDAIILVTTGDVDLSVYLPETALLDAIESDETEALITPRAGAVKSYAFNLNDPDNLEMPHPIFSDVDVRRAIVLGFDRWNVVSMLLLDQAGVPGTPLSNSFWENTELDPMPYDPGRAAELLDDAGWELADDGLRYRAGVPLAFTVTTMAGDDPESVLRQRVQQLFIDDMADLGISVEAENYAIEHLVGTDAEPGILGQRAYDVVDIPWNHRTTLDMFIERFGEAFIPGPDYAEGANIMGYANDEVNQLLREQSVELDPEERAAILAEVQEIVTNDVPIILIYDHIEIDMARTYVHGLDPGPEAGLWWNVEDWWISREEVLS
jgi:peptide/nickel transport system substrate-binding protein